MLSANIKMESDSLTHIIQGDQGKPLNKETFEQRLERNDSVSCEVIWRNILPGRFKGPGAEEDLEMVKKQQEVIVNQIQSRDSVRLKSSTWSEKQFFKFSLDRQIFSKLYVNAMFTLKLGTWQECTVSLTSRCPSQEKAQERKSKCIT